MSMLVISVDRRTLLDAAGRTRVVADQIDGIGQRLVGLPIPQGAERIAGTVDSVAAGFSSERDLVEGLRRWLLDRAQRAILADLGIFGASAPLIPGSPWGVVKPKRPNIVDGLRVGVTELVTGLGVLGYGTGVGIYDGARNTYGSWKLTMAGAYGARTRYKTDTKWARQYRESMRAMADDPVGYAKGAAKDTVAWDDFADGNTGFAIGKLLPNLASSLLPGARAGALTTRAAARSAAAGAARRGHASSVNRFEGATIQRTDAMHRVTSIEDPGPRGSAESAQEYSDRLADHQQAKNQARAEYRDLRREHERAQGAMDDAKRKADQATAKASLASAAAATAAATAGASVRDNTVGILKPGPKDLAAQIPNVGSNLAEEQRKQAEAKAARDARLAAGRR